MLGETARCPFRGCSRPAGEGETRACCGRHSTAIIARQRAHRDGFILLVDASRKLKVDPRVLVSLHDSGQIEGKQVNRGIWLSRHDLIRYAFSQPRCIVEGCSRRVIGGEGPGCSRHRSHGRKHSLASRHKRAEKLRTGPVVEKVCEWCGERFTLLPWQARVYAGRFCSHKCELDWLHRGPDAGARHARLQEGRKRWREIRVNDKAASGLRAVPEIAAALPLEFRRAASVVYAHVAAGRLTPTPNQFGELLFSEDEFQRYLSWLREHPDGRLQRFNATSQHRALFRGKWFRARYDSMAEFGRLASLLAAAKGKKSGRRIELSDTEIALIDDMTRRGRSQRTIAAKVGCSRDQVRGQQARRQP